MIHTTLEFRRSRNYVLPPVDQRMRVGFLALDFSLSPSYEYDFSYTSNDGAEIVVQSLVIDNSANAADLTITVDKSLQFSRTVKAGEFRTFNVPAFDKGYFKFESTGTAVVKAYLQNFPALPDSAYVAGGGAPAKIESITDNCAFHQTAPAVGVVDAEILAARAGRKSLLIQNNDPGGGDLYINFGAAATADHLVIHAGGYAEFKGPAPSNSVHALGSAALTKIVAIEGY